MGLFVSLLFGLIGSAYLVYGKRQGETWFIFTGFVMLIFPYFLSNVALSLLVGTALMLFPVAKLNGWF